jgi:hypothetical protein
MVGVCKDSISEIFLPSQFVNSHHYFFILAEYQVQQKKLQMKELDTNPRLKNDKFNTKLYKIYQQKCIQSFINIPIPLIDIALHNERKETKGKTYYKNPSIELKSFSKQLFFFTT